MILGERLLVICKMMCLELYIRNYKNLTFVLNKFSHFQPLNHIFFIPPMHEGKYVNYY